MVFTYPPREGEIDLLKFQFKKNYVSYFDDEWQFYLDSMEKLYEDIVNFFAAKYLKIYFGNKNNFSDLVIPHEKRFIKHILQIFLTYWETFFEANFSHYLGHYLKHDQKNLQYEKLIEFINDLKVLTHLDKYGLKIKDTIETVLKHLRNTLIYLLVRDDSEGEKDLMYNMILSRESALQCLNYIKQQKAESKYKTKYIKYMNWYRNEVENFIRERRELFGNVENVYINRDGIKYLLYHLNLIKENGDDVEMEVEEIGAKNSTKKIRKRRRPKTEETKPNKRVRENLKPPEFKTIEKEQNFLPLIKKDAYINDLIKDLEAVVRSVEDEVKPFLNENLYLIGKKKGMGAGETNAFDTLIKQQGMLCKHNLLYKTSDGKNDKFYFKNSKTTVIVDVDNKNKVQIYKQVYSQQDLIYGVLQPEFLPSSLFYEIFDKFKTRKYQWGNGVGTQFVNDIREQNLLLLSNIFSKFYLSPAGEMEVDNTPLELQTLLQNIKPYNSNGTRQRDINFGKDSEGEVEYISIIKMLKTGLGRNQVFKINSLQKLHYWIVNVISIIKYYKEQNKPDGQLLAIKEIVREDFNTDTIRGYNKVGTNFYQNVRQTVLEFCFTDRRKDDDSGTKGVSSLKTYDIKLQSYKWIVYLFLRGDLQKFKEKNFKFIYNHMTNENINNDKKILKMFTTNDANFTTGHTEDLCRTELYFEFYDDVDNIISYITTLENENRPVLSQSRTKYSNTVRDDFNINYDLEPDILNKNVKTEVAKMFYWNDGMKFKTLLHLLKLGIPIVYGNNWAEDDERLYRDNIYELESYKVKKVIYHLCFTIGFSKTQASDILKLIVKFRNEAKIYEKETTSISIFDIKLRKIQYEATVKILKYWKNVIDPVEEENIFVFDSNTKGNTTKVGEQFNISDSTQFLTNMSQFQQSTDDFIMDFCSKISAVPNALILLDLDFDNFDNDMFNNQYMFHIVLYMLGHVGENKSDLKEFYTKTIHFTYKTIQEYTYIDPVKLSSQKLINLENSIQRFKNLAFNDVQSRVHNYTLRVDLQEQINKTLTKTELKEFEQQNLGWRIGAQFASSQFMVKSVANGLAFAATKLAAPGAALLMTATANPLLISFVSAVAGAGFSYYINNEQLNTFYNEQNATLTKIQQNFNIEMKKGGLNFLVKKTFENMQMLFKETLQRVARRNELEKEKFQVINNAITVVEGGLGILGLTIPNFVKDDLYTWARNSIIRDNPIHYNETTGLFIDTLKNTTYKILENVRYDDVCDNITLLEKAKENLQSQFNIINQKIPLLMDATKETYYNSATGLHVGRFNRFPFSDTSLQALETPWKRFRGYTIKEMIDMTVSLNAELPELQRKLEETTSDLEGLVCEAENIITLAEPSEEVINEAESILQTLTDVDKIIETAIEYTTVNGAFYGVKLFCMYLKIFKNMNEVKIAGVEIKVNKINYFSDNFLLVNSIIKKYFSSQGLTVTILDIYTQLWSIAGFVLLNANNLWNFNNKNFKKLINNATRFLFTNVIVGFTVAASWKTLIVENAFLPNMFTGALLSALAVDLQPRLKNYIIQKSIPHYYVFTVNFNYIFWDSIRWVNWE